MNTEVEEFLNFNSELNTMINDIQKMSKKDLSTVTINLILKINELQEQYSTLLERHQEVNTDYLLRCRSSGGVTLPPNF